MDRLRLQLNSRREHNTIAPNDECTINGRKLPDGLLRPPPEARPFTRPGATCAISRTCTNGFYWEGCAALGRV